jgi:hypothetical protein
LTYDCFVASIDQFWEDFADRFFLSNNVSDPYGCQQIDDSTAVSVFSQCAEKLVQLLPSSASRVNAGNEYRNYVNAVIDSFKGLEGVVPANKFDKLLVELRKQSHSLFDTKIGKGVTGWWENWKKIRS